MDKSEIITALSTDQVKSPEDERITDFKSDTVLAHLGLEREQPSLEYLRRLQVAFREGVPFETASRVLLFAEVGEATARPRRPATFWHNAIEHGLGGSCSEMAYAYWALLGKLGFDASLAICDWLDNERVHATVLVEINGEGFDSAASAGHHVRAPLPISDDPRISLEGESPPGEPYHYVVDRRDETHYELMNYGPRWEKTETNQLYVLNSSPVNIEEYDRWMVSNYADGGTFSEHLTLHRRRSDGTELRYNPEDGLRVWDGNEWTPVDVGDAGDVSSAELAARFRMPEEILRRAHAVVAK
jgi:arylamine N-acetyltransferase